MTAFQTLRSIVTAFQTLNSSLKNTANSDLTKPSRMPGCCRSIFVFVLFDFCLLLVCVLLLFGLCVVLFLLFVCFVCAEHVAQTKLKIYNSGFCFKLPCWFYVDYVKGGRALTVNAHLAQSIKEAAALDKQSRILNGFVVVVVVLLLLLLRACVRVCVFLVCVCVCVCVRACVRACVRVWRVLFVWFFRLLLLLFAQPVTIIRRPSSNSVSKCRVNSTGYFKKQILDF